MGIGCVANWIRNRTLPCVITVPVFLIAGFVLLVSGVATIRVNPSWV